MIDTVKSLGTAPGLDDRRGRGPSADPASDDSPTAPPAPEAQSDIRLLIEQSQDTGVYVYTLIDQTTGRVLARIPRQQVEAMGRAADYSAGAVVSTKA